MKSRRHEVIGDVLANAARFGGVVLVIREMKGIDRFMIMFRNGKLYRFAGEVEMTERNCINNCLRDLRDIECDAVITVCADEGIRTRVAKKIAKYLPEDLKPRVGIFSYADIEKGIVTQWIDSVAGRDVCLNHRCNEKPDREVCDE